MALLCLSDTVQKDWKRQYGDVLVGVTTTSLYPSIIMSLNIGKETLIGRVLIPDEKVVVEGKEIFNNRYGLNDLKVMEREALLAENLNKQMKFRAMPRQIYVI